MPKNQKEKKLELSPTSGLKLFLECPRCFWLRYREGDHRPDTIFPSIQGGMYRIIKDYFDYFMPIWRTFWEYKFDEMKVEVDGEEIFHGRSLVFVGNISRYAVGLQILHYADFSDGLLDVCIYKCASRIHLVKHSIMTILKQHADGRDVIYRQGKEISVSSTSADIETEIDGDPGPPLPVKIKVIPQAVNCIVPEGAKPAGIRTRIIRAIG